MKNILITGGAGSIGSALAKRLFLLGKYKITLVDNLITGSLSNIPEGVRFIKSDVNNYIEIAPIFISGSFDYVFHYSAIVGVERTLSSPTLVLKDIDGIKNICDLSKNISIKRVFYSSSSEVYGEPVEIPQNEDTTTLNSRLTYAIVKIWERLIYVHIKRNMDLILLFFVFLIHMVQNKAKTLLFLYL